MTSIDKDEVAQELSDIVAEFNTKFNDWMNAHGCRAEFAWRYGSDRTQVKYLDVQAIDLIVFRKKAPDFNSVREVINNAP